MHNFKCQPKFIDQIYMSKSENSISKNLAIFAAKYPGKMKFVSSVNF